jgi:hypothetical protein
MVVRVCRLSRARGDTQPECHSFRDWKLGPVHTALHVSIQEKKYHVFGLMDGLDFSFFFG